jgi:hypothetical protein
LQSLEETHQEKLLRNYTERSLFMIDFSSPGF